MAGERLKKYGENKIEEKKKKGIIRKFIEQFSDFMVIILLIAAVISFVTSWIENNSDYIDSIIILVIVIINAIIGVIQENRAEKAIDALKKLSSPKSRVIRASKEIIISSEDLVPGDILLLKAGDFISADARIIDNIDLKTEESALTGESLPVEKYANFICEKNCGVGELRNMVFSTTMVISGKARCVVTDTGMNTQVGKIANLINEGEPPQTPLQRKLKQTGKYLSAVAIIVCMIIFILGVIQNVDPFDMFMISISLAVAAIPEGLPAVVTIVLAMGVKTMAKNRAIIRKLPAVETLGGATVICSDKTGTLTQNKMKVVELRSSQRQIRLNSPEGMEILKLSALCNNSKVMWDSKEVKIIGDPTESALLRAYRDLKNDIPNQNRVNEIPFDSTRKLMTTIHRLSNGKYKVITKGAPDVLLNRCKFYMSDLGIMPLDNNKRREIEQQNEGMASKALRVLAVSSKDVDYISKDKRLLENDLIFFGLVGMVDPPRDGVKKAVKECLSAGVLPVMITGDHIVTAKAIAKDIGMLKRGDKAISGNELDRLSPKELQNRIFNYTVFARVSPQHKVDIVKAFQNRGAVVAMTGDGVNDAPALKRADIGCAMGLSGTDVAKGAADMILTDDNFLTIVEAVRRGRGIYENIKKTVHFLLSSNIGEIITVLTAFILKMPAPLLAIQLLWVNLVTDSLPALAIGVEEVDKDIMKHPPSSKSLFSGGLGFSIAVEGFFIGAISMLAFTIGFAFFDSTSNPIIGRTMAFSVLSLSQLVHAFNIRSKRSIIKSNILSNKSMIYSFLICMFLQISVISVPMFSSVFKTYPLNPIQWIIVSALALSPLIIVEIEKALYRHKNKISR